jgi:AcrR family transcriptional regulator
MEKYEVSMGSRERRQREKASMKQLIVDTAMNIVQKDGVAGLTIRSLAEQIEYSPCIIYEYFENKEVVCRELCAQICAALLSTLQAVPSSRDPEKYFIALIRANVDFLMKRPEGIELLTMSCFGPDESTIPKDFLSSAEIFSQALKQCQCKRLSTGKELNAALDVLRSLHVGMITLSTFQTSTEGLKRIGNSLENGIIALLRGWKS